jgi:hypothetical protein
MESDGNARLDFPVELAFEPHQLCNAACFCCPYTWLSKEANYTTQRMSREGIQGLIDEFADNARRLHGYDGRLTIYPFRFSDPLLCTDLDVVLKCAAQKRVHVVITTNGIGLSGHNLELLEEYRPWITKLSVSLIGSTKDEVRELMGLDFDRVMKNIENIKLRHPKVREVLRVGLRETMNTPAERAVLESARQNFRDSGVVVKSIRAKWITNRVDAAEFTQGQSPVRLEPEPPSERRFVAGCGWANHLLKRMEVMVDGSVVLCCDDAEKHKVFGNVFDEGVHAIWNGALKTEHLAVVSPRYSASKHQLICDTCTRAVWSSGPAVGIEQPLS